MDRAFWRTCKKCGIYGKENVRYHQGHTMVRVDGGMFSNFRCNEITGLEHLLVVCTTCQHQWTEPTIDNKYNGT